ncbi:MAG: hypothetical protein KC550_03755 [Nanoarchaeota archaeon]|nr:hypothetical protein [Nanoarchaeota archaeon]
MSKKLVYELVRYSGRYGDTLGSFRSLVDAVVFGDAVRQGYEGLSFDMENLACGFRFGIAASDRLRHLTISEMEEFSDDKIIKFRNKNIGFPKQLYKGLFLDDILRPTTFYFTGYLLGNLARVISN